MADIRSILHGRNQAVFSSEAERSLVSSFFGREKGVFVEVGAFDPVFQSQSYHLELIGWDGILVEPEPQQAEMLRKSRRAQVFEVACVGPDAADRPASLLSQRGHSTLHFDRKAAGRALVIEVTTTTLNKILAEAGFDHVDFLSVDVEGAEPDVLRGLDFNRFQPRLVLVDDRDRFGLTCRVMARNRYKLVRRTGHNAWFVPADSGFTVGKRARLHLGWAYGPGRLVDRKRGPTRRRTSRPALVDARMALLRLGLGRRKAAPTFQPA